MKRLIKRIEFYAFLVPIIAVAFVSISHVTSWYSISNPYSWAIYLSVGIEIAALSSLAGFSVGLGRNIYPPFIIVTIIQFIGNIFYNFQYIDVNGDLFKDWVVLVSPIMELAGIDPNDIDSHKRILAFLEGGFLPPISLFFLHLLIKLSEKTKEFEAEEVKTLSIVEPVAINDVPEEVSPEVEINNEEVVNEEVTDMKNEEVLVNEPMEEENISEVSVETEKDVIVVDPVGDGKRRLRYKKRDD